jgi:predicted nucleic acid-binding protein
MSAERVCYLDSSAIVKLIVKEQESAALSRYLRGRQALISSALARTEVKRAVLHLGADAVQRADEALNRIDLVRLNNAVLNAAGVMKPEELRSLDAIHLATAALLEGTLSDLVTYDSRMATAARAHGWAVTAPA